MTDPRPLIIGVVRVPAERPRTFGQTWRLALSAYANAEGYGLLEIFEVCGNPRRAEQVYAALDGLSSRVDAAALLTSGMVDRERLEAIADRLRMRILQVPPAGRFR